MTLSRSKIVFCRMAGLLIIPALILSMPACVKPASKAAVSGVYDYPVKPGTAEWKALGSHVEMLKVCQIPDSNLTRMSTADLLETVLNYPLFLDALAYNWPQQGFDAVSGQFNGLQELLKRPDGGTVLLAKYKAMDPKALGQDWTDLQKGGYAFKFMYIEMLLAQPTILNRFTAGQKRELVREQLVKTDAKRQSEIYGGLSQASSLWVIARVLEHVNYAPFMNAIAADSHYQGFVDKGSFADDAITQDIIKQAQGYLGLSVVTDMGPAVTAVATGKYSEPAIRPPGLPASAKFNPDTNEYYDSSIVEWDSMRQRYVDIEQSPVFSAPAENMQRLSIEDWLTQHKDSMDPVDIAVTKYYSAIEAYRSAHPEVGFRSDWGIDYTGEFKILTDPGVEGLPGLLKEVEVDSPVVVPVIFAINEICKTDFGYIGSFSAEEIILWKMAFNNKSSKAGDTVAKVVQALRNNPSANDETISKKLGDAGIFGLPYFYDEIVNKANYSLITYTGLILPAAEMTKFDLQSGSNDKDKVISALKSCQTEIAMIRTLAVQ